MTSAEQRDIAKRIAARFRAPWHRDYARNKLRFDPAYAAVAVLVGDSRIDLLDIGCGLGLLGFYLRECGFRGGYRGLDFDAKKISAARKAVADADALVFECSEAQCLPEFHGHVALLDVLHYLSADAQQNLLREAAARVAPGAMLIIRSVLRERGWRFRATVIEEYFIYATRWMRSAAVRYPTREEIETTLRASGLTADVRTLWGHTPFNSFLIVAQRDATKTD